MAEHGYRGKAGESVKTSHPAVPRSHHNSHLALVELATVADTGPSSLDAIVVPTARPAENLRRAMALARNLDRPLVALCSRRASVEDSALLGKKMGVNVTAFDTAEILGKALPSFSTTGLLHETAFEHSSDTGAKRNLALLLARLMGWQRIVFLDDDIKVPDPADLLRASRLLDRYTAVGLRIGGFPDNSVVCHAHRETGGAQRTFIGAGALAVDTRSSMSSFFPDIYNEDWFFLLDGERMHPVAITGAARQKRYNPYADQRRARHEEFGDILAEGVFFQLDAGKSVSAADEEFWTEYLGIRLAFIDDVMSRVWSATKSSSEKKRMVDALRAARGRCEIITPQLCVDYLRAWQDDREKWRQHVEDTVAQPGAELDKVLSGLTLLSSSCRTST
jgi:hypothetical protein